MKKQIDMLRDAVDVCPRCKSRTTSHISVCREGIWLVTHHCRQHGDVIPERRVVLDDPDWSAA